MTAEILTIEVGSTLTKAVALGEDGVLARTVALSTPENIMVGVDDALARLKARSGIETRNAGAVFATSSAAGGLRVTVHGLTRDLTARAAEEASLGAGANVRLITAGPIRDRDRQRIAAIRPNLMILAGGVDFGAEETILENARILARIAVGAPVVFAGNACLREEVAGLFGEQGRELFLVDNVYPGFDELNVEPVRRIMRELFASRLILAPGMDALRALADGKLMAVPGACLKAAETLARRTGDLVVVDVGGATTDVHSVVGEPGEANLEPQPGSKRTVEGDLGLYASASSVWAALGREGEPRPLSPLPSTPEEEAVSAELACKAVELALARHAGRILHGALLGDGRPQVKGRDLRGVKLVVGTGGGLAGLEGGRERIRSALATHRRDLLLPGSDVDVRIDRHYVFSACGAFAEVRPELAVSAICRSMGLEP